jgi:hypothetical protein
LNLIVGLLSHRGVEVLTAHADGGDATAGGQRRDPDPANGPDSRVGVAGSIAVSDGLTASPVLIGWL